MPVSRTSQRTNTPCASFESTLSASETSPSVSELHGVAAEVQQDLPDAPGVALDGGRQIRIDLQCDFQALRVRLHGQQTSHVFERVAQVHVGGFQFELAGLDLGEVQNVVDHGQQRARRCP